MLDWLKKKVTTPVPPPPAVQGPEVSVPAPPKFVDVGQILAVVLTKDGKRFVRKFTGDYLGENPAEEPGNSWIVRAESKVRTWRMLGDSTGHLAVGPGSYIPTADVESVELARSEHKVRVTP